MQNRSGRQRAVGARNDRRVVTGADACGGGSSEFLQSKYCPVACSLLISRVIWSWPAASGTIRISKWLPPKDQITLELGGQLRESPTAQ